MLGLKITSLNLPHYAIPSISGRPLVCLPPTGNLPSLSFPLKTQFKLHKSQSSFLLFAQNGTDDITQEEPNKQQQQKASSINGGGGGGGGGGGEGGRGGEGGGDDDLRTDRRPSFNIKWVELLLDPDPDNILAVGLTGLLAWASVQVLWQLFFISFAILLAAVKYSFIAALLIFILITLL